MARTRGNIISKLETEKFLREKFGADGEVAKATSTSDTYFAAKNNLFISGIIILSWVQDARLNIFL